ncbi:MAG: tripartite tricarboxylate transporter TctB family protein [Burkholderiales bacterium]
MKQGDFWSGLALAALGGGIVYAASGWDYLTPEGPGAGFFPLWYGIALLVLAVLLVVQSLRDGAPAEARKPFTAGHRRVIAVVIALAVTVVLLKVIGFTAAFGLLTLLPVRVLYARTWPVAVGTAAGLAAGFYLVFVFALGVELPAGPLGF